MSIPCVFKVLKSRVFCIKSWKRTFYVSAVCHEYLINHSINSRLIAYFTWIHSYQDKVVVDCKLTCKNATTPKLLEILVVCLPNEQRFFFFKIIINARHFHSVRMLQHYQFKDRKDLLALLCSSVLLIGV